jgi:hypothetical protein
MSKGETIITTSRCPNCMADNRIRLKANQVPRMGARFQFQCKKCEATVIDAVGAVCLMDASAKFDAEANVKED